MAFPYPYPTSESVSQRMRQNRRTDTKPERLVRSELHRQGFRYRTHLAIRTPERVIRPDIVFPRQHLAVFVDGCFWHCCPDHGNVPRANRDYWRPKLERNVIRDRAVDRSLADSGWTVMRAWEHEDPVDVANRVGAVLRRRCLARR